VQRRDTILWVSRWGLTSGRDNRITSQVSSKRLGRRVQHGGAQHPGWGRIRQTADRAALSRRSMVACPVLIGSRIGKERAGCAHPDRWPDGGRCCPDSLSI